MRQYSREEGASLIFFVIVIPVVAALVILAINVGLFSVATVQLESHLDSGSLAAAGNGMEKFRRTGSLDQIEIGIHQFDGDPNDPGTNQVMGISPNVQFSDGNGNLVDGKFYKWDPELGLEPRTVAQYTDVNAVEITHSMQIPTVLGSLIGVPNLTVTGKSVAIQSGPGCLPITLPITLMDCPFQPSLNICTSANCNQPIYVTTMGPSPTDNAAFFEPPGEPANAQNCKDRVTGAIPPQWLCVGDEIEINNGVINSCMAEIENKCNEMREESPARCVVNNGWQAYLPLISCEDYLDPEGNFVQQAKIKGFVSVGVEDAHAHGAHSYADLRLYCGQNTPNAPSGGRFCGFHAQPTLVD